VRTCANINPVPTSNTFCTSWKLSCRFNGNTCVDAAACNYSFGSNYTGKTETEKRALCEELTDETVDKKKCAYIKDATTCTPRSCGNISTTPNSIEDCTKWLPTCTYIN
jgi:hypothetical protein